VIAASPLLRSARVTVGSGTCAFFASCWADHPRRERASLISREHQNASPQIWVCRKWLNAVPIHQAKKPEKPVNNSMAEPKMKAFMSSLVGKVVKAPLNVDAQRSCGDGGLIGANRQRRREFKLIRQTVRR
jgi:hypothetical protein